MSKRQQCFKILLSSALLLLLAISGCNKFSKTTDTSSKNSQKAIETPKPKAIADNSAVDADVKISLSVEGLLVVDKQKAPTTILYDTDSTIAIAAISDALGKPTTTSTNDECGAGTMNFVTWSNGLTMNVIKGRFVGWTVSPDTESANLTTVNGVGLGKTVADLKENYNVEVIESSLGTEFYTSRSSSLSGLLSADEPNGTIIALWSGTACNFR